MVASNGGESRPPDGSCTWAWTPRDGDDRRCGAARDARPATGDESTRGVAGMITGVHPGYAAYQRRTDRPIPVVILSPEPQG